jgi:integrase
MQFRYRFSIKNPAGIRKSYDIVCDKRSPDKRIQKTIKKIKEFEPEATALTEINERFHSAKLDEATAKVMCEQVVKGLYSRVNTIKDAYSNVVISDANFRLFNEYWTDVYSDRKLKDRDRTLNTFLYTLKVLEPHSILGTDKETLRKHFEKKLSGNAHRRYTVYLNMLLTYYKRGFTLAVGKTQLGQIDFVDIDEFKTVIAKMEDPRLRSLIATLFCTGCRTGEAFAFTKQSIKSDLAVFISHQIDRKLVRRETKNSREHDAVIIADFLPELRYWCSLPYKEKIEIRKTCGHDISAFFAKHSVEATAHDLRHSYVHYLAGKGLSLDDISSCIGDTREVTERHYKGWILGDRRVAHLAKLVNS